MGPPPSPAANVFPLSWDSPLDLGCRAWVVVLLVGSMAVRLGAGQAGRGARGAWCIRGLGAVLAISAVCDFVRLKKPVCINHCASNMPWALALRSPKPNDPTKSTSSLPDTSPMHALKSPPTIRHPFLETQLSSNTYNSVCIPSNSIISSQDVGISNANSRRVSMERNVM